MSKFIDNQGNPAPDILIIDEMQVLNPTDEQYLAAGYHLEKAPIPNTDETDSLSEAKAAKIKEILEYDASEEVNSFIYGGYPGWFTAEQRANFKVSIDAADILGDKEITFWFGVPFTLPTAVAKRGLAMIQRYADKCFLVTQKHIKQVNSLMGVADVRSFDVTKGYPKRLILNDIYNETKGSFLEAGNQ